MSCNVGNTDRIVRFIIGIALLIWAFAGLQGGWAWVAGIVGLVLIGTAWIKFCPLYTLFGISTCPADQKS